MITEKSKLEHSTLYLVNARRGDKGWHSEGAHRDFDSALKSFRRFDARGINARIVCKITTKDTSVVMENSPPVTTSSVE